VSEADSPREEPEAIVHIVDDDKAARDGLAQAISTPSRRIQTYSSAEDFLRGYEDRAPGCLILDMRMPAGMSGVALMRQLRERRIIIPTIAVTGHPQWQVARDMMGLGAFDYVEKPIRNMPGFQDLVEQALRRDRDERIVRIKRLETLARLSTLSPREHEILDNIVDDKSSAEVANILGLSQKTVEGHRSTVLKKMGVESTVQLVRLLCQANVI